MLFRSGNGYLDTRRGERRKVLLQAGRGELADNEVALEAYTIERDVVRLEAVHEVEHRGGLRTGLLDVIVVDVELRIRVRSPGSIQGNRDEVSTKGIVENIGAPSSIIVERLCNVL